MRAFIFDKYGYYPANENDSEFELEGWHFSLEMSNKTEDELYRLDEYLQSINRLFPDAGCRIVRNRDGNYLSVADYGNMSLIAIKEKTFSLNDLIKLHVHYQNQLQGIDYKVSETINLWEEKITLMEEKIIPSIKIDDYAYLYAMETTIHGLGLAENAMQYLSEARMDFGDKLPRLTITHRRLSTLDSKLFLNPFNLIIDSPMRDLAELFKSEILDVNSALEILKIYNATAFEASMFFARVLFPTTLFDYLEDHFSIRKDVREHIISYRDFLPKQMTRIKELHHALTISHSIRPISWLNE